MPIVSIVVPVYKVERYLRSCVDSILAQTYSDIELILVDDGSPDSCGAICDEYAERDTRIHVIHQDNGGLSAARNSGIEWALNNSNSEWITFIDSDDRVHPRYLEILINAAISLKQTVAIGGFVRTDKLQGFPEIPEKIKTEVRETEEFYCSEKVTATVAWGKVYRKELFAKVRYPVRKLHEDEFTTYLVLFCSKTVAFANCPLYSYYQNPQSIMGSGWDPRHIAECDGMKEQLLYFERNDFAKAERYLSGVYLKSIYRNLRNAESDKKYDAEKAMLQRRLKKEIKRYGKLCGMSIKSDPWLYYEAYPIATLPIRAFRKLNK